MLNGTTYSISAWAAPPIVCGSYFVIACGTACYPLLNVDMEYKI